MIVVAGSCQDLVISLEFYSEIEVEEESESASLKGLPVLPKMAAPRPLWSLGTGRWLA